MGDLKVQDKQIVVPGELLATGMDFLPTAGTYRDGESIFASRLGMVSAQGRVLKLVPLSGAYLPKKGDVIIGRVFDITFSGWRLEINSAYSCMLSLKDATSEFISRGADLTRYYGFDDYLLMKVVTVTSQNLVDVTLKGPGLRKLGEGRIIDVEVHKVPRIIGKQGSMVNLIKEKTGVKLTVGQNGLVWVSGEPDGERKAIAAIRKIEEESHVSGLTERVSAFLDGGAK